MPEKMNRLPQELEDIERLLGGLKPAAALDRDRVLFEGGRVAGLRAGRIRRRLAFALCGLLAIACAVMAAFPRERTAEHVLVKAAPRQPAPSLAAGTAPDASPPERAPDVMMKIAGGSYLELRQRVLSAGMAALAPVRTTPGSNSTITPSLQRGEGIEALTPWQQRMALTGIGG